MADVAFQYLDHMHKRIRELMNDQADHLSGGGCPSFEDYKYACGMVHAFALIEVEVLELKKNFSSE